MASIFDVKPKTPITPFNAVTQPKPFNFTPPSGIPTPFNATQPKVIPNSQTMMPTQLPQSKVSDTPTILSERNTDIKPPVSSANSSGSYKGVPMIGNDVNSIMAQMAAIDARPVPGENPPAVTVPIPETTTGDSLNGNANATRLGEKNKDTKNKVLTNRFQREEEETLKNVTELLSGLANLKGIQAKEYAAEEKNPGGKFGGALQSDLSRLSRDQAIELSARTGQLNAELDALKLYQGYAPSVIGSPQIDETTGEAFVYMQDPSTGQVTTQSLGQMMTPDPTKGYQTLSAGQSIFDPTTGQFVYQAPQKEEYQTLSEGEAIYDPKTGQLVYKNPKTYGPTGGGSYSSDPAVSYYSDLLAQGKISLSNVPQGIRNAVVIASQGNINKSLTTGEITSIAELQNGLDGLTDLRAKVLADSSVLGPISGLAAINPWSSSRQIRADIDRVRQKVGKALEGGVLRKEDEIKYAKILSTLTDTPETAIYKIDQLIQDLQSDLQNFQTGLTTGNRYLGESQTPDYEKLLEEAFK